MLRAATILLALLILTSVGLAEVTVAPVFSDHMVLQRDGPAPVWGRADPGETVTVSLGRKSMKARAGTDGRWMVRFLGLRAGGPYLLKVRGRRGKPVIFRDVLVGEVWLCSGQSNMAWPVSRSRDGAAEAQGAKFPAIRFLTIPRRPSSTPLLKVGPTWTVCTQQTAGRFSAVGYFFGRELHRRLKVPIGLINSSVGGTRSEAWTRLSALEADPRFEKHLDGWKKRVAADASGKLAENVHRPGNLYNGMIAPLLPYGIRGAIWYQGESNASRAEQYRALFPALIRNWREDWGQGDFPFYFVQLANYTAVTPEPGHSAWAELRDAQLSTLTLENTGMAVTIDIGEAKDIHPKNKQDVGLRLARWALARDYGKKVVVSGPLLDSSEIRGAEVVLRLLHTDGGLRTADGEAVKGFAIAGEDRNFVWAEARIEGETIIVHHPDIPRPAAVRYAWANNPVCNLVNGEGLPASPFRTDDWPGITAGKD